MYYKSETYTPEDEANIAAVIGGLSIIIVGLCFVVASIIIASAWLFVKAVEYAPMRSVQAASVIDESGRDGSAADEKHRLFYESKQVVVLPEPQQPAPAIGK